MQEVEDSMETPDIISTALCNFVRSTTYVLSTRHMIRMHIPTLCLTLYVIDWHSEPTQHKYDNHD